MNINASSDHTRVSDLRKSGNIQEAANEINKLLSYSISDPPLLVEAVKIMLLLGQYSEAYNVLRKICGFPDKFQYLEGEILCRLQCHLPEVRIQELHSSDLKCQTIWAKKYISEGTDSTKTVSIVGARFASQTGSLISLFEVRCPDCHNHLHLNTPITFMIERSFTCPSCFVNLIFNYEEIKKYIEKHHPNLATQNSEIEFMDNMLFDIQEEANHYDTPGLPNFIRHLNQQYIYILLQMCLEKHLQTKA